MKKRIKSRQMFRRKITKSLLIQILGRQRYRCANRPDLFPAGLKEYQCPLWRHGDGVFDLAGPQIDHIVELRHGGIDSIDNMQALCPNCHAAKTRANDSR